MATALHKEYATYANGASASPYKYGGKEHISFANAHLLDFSARTYDPAILSFLQPDPCQEKYYPLSPYLYCAANPVNHVDPTGCDTVRVDSQGYITTISDSGDDILICIDRDGMEHIMDNLPNGTLYYRIGVNNGKESEYAGFSIDGGCRSEEIFKFLATHTNVEWSLAKVGPKEDVNGYITTGHLIDEEPIMGRWIMQTLRNNKITELWHSHPSNTEIPSGDDLYFRDELSPLLNYPKFYIFIPFPKDNGISVLNYTYYGYGDGIILDVITVGPD